MMVDSNLVQLLSETTDSIWPSIIESSNYAFITKSLTGQVTSWNSAAEELFGFSKDEMIGEKMLKVFPPDRIDEEDEILEKIAAGERIKHFRTVRLHKNQTLIHISTSISPIYNSDNQIIGASVTAKDISDIIENEINNAHYTAIVRDSDDAIISKTLNGTVLSWNTGAEMLYGYPTEEMIGEKLVKLFPKHLQYEEADILHQIVQGKKVEHFKTQRLKKDGRLIDVSVTVSPIYDESGNIIGASQISRDISLQVAHELTISHYKSMVDCSDDGIISKSVNGYIETWNQGAEKIFGYTADEIIGLHVSLLYPKERIEEEQRLLKNIYAGKSVKNFRTTRLDKNGNALFISVSISPLKNAQGIITGFTSIVRNLTQEVIGQIEPEQNALFDSVTGLLNHEGLNHEIENQIHLALENPFGFNVIKILLRNCSEITNKLAPEQGDLFIKELSKIITKCAYSKSSEAKVARLEQCAFVILMPESQTFEEESFETFISVIQDNIHLNEANSDKKIIPEFAIGSVSFPLDGMDYKTLMTRAEIALRSSQPNQVTFYSELTKSFNIDTYTLVHALKNALHHEQFRLVYQPIVDAKTRKICKAEALIRWQHPDFGNVPPDMFIPLAEKFGLINDITDWVLRQALSHLQIWTYLYGLDFQVSVNISSFDLDDEDIRIQRMSEYLHQYGLMGSNLILEVTEHSLVGNATTAAKILNGYRDLGIEIALDDFGTGFASLDYLKKLPIDLLKIDRSFVQSIVDDARDFQICQGITQIAKNLNLKIVAEGVENEATSLALNKLQSDYLQGYLFSKPLEFAEFEAYLQQ